MSPERSEYKITLEEIMLRDGHHVPILIVEGSKTLVAGQIQDLPDTHGARMELMRSLGQAAAKSGSIDQLQQVFMVSEGWMSESSDDEPTDIRPSEDPSRKEVLIISAMQIKELKKQMKVLEIIRDSSEQVARIEEFLPAEHKRDESIELPLLEAFVQGFQLAFRTRFN